MNNIIKEKILLPSWELIKDDTKIKKYYIFPWLLSIIFLTALLVYQSIYTYVELFWKKEEALVIILKFFHSSYIKEILITSILFLIIYFLLLPIFEWWLIQYLDKKNKNIDITTGEAFWLWIYKFLPIFEYNNMFSEFKIISILNWYLFTIRFIWIEYINITSYVFLIILFFWMIINILFSYAKYSIVLWNRWIFESIWESSKITILNLTTTIRLYFFVFFLNTRVVINFILFLIFPIIIVSVIWVISTKFYLFITITILSIIFILFILIIWYLTAVLEIFTTAIWYYAYIEWKKRLNEEKTD